jgi:hypothetical protein
MATKFGMPIQRAGLDLLKILVGGWQPLPNFRKIFPDFAWELNGGQKFFLKNTSRPPMTTKFGMPIQRAVLDLLKILVGGRRPLPNFRKIFPDFAWELNGGQKIFFKKYFPSADGHQIRYANPAGGPRFFKNIGGRPAATPSVLSILLWFCANLMATFDPRAHGVEICNLKCQHS